MADPRTFVLIGEFKDGITPELQKINNQLASLKNSFANLGGKGARNASRDMGRFSVAVSSLSQNLKEQNQALRAAILPMREYRKEVGKTVGALMQLNAASGRRGAAAGIDATNRALREQIRLMAQVSQQSQRLNSQRPPGGGRRGGRGGGMDLGPVPYQQPPRDNQRRYQGSVARDATFAFGQTLGYQLSNTITGSIVQGFQIGVGLMMKPFQYFMDGFSERVKDESTDVQTAGAMFAIAQRKNMNMFQNFNQAIRAQQAINYKLAQSAAALPGATTEYVQMGKRVLDSMMTVLSKDVKGVSAFAAELGAKPGDKQDVLSTLTQKFTEKAVLLGQGSTYRGNYGVPQLLEQLIGKEQVSENMFNKFAMYRDLPIFQSVFKDMEGELAKTGAYSADRIRLVFKLLDEALPNEVIQAHKNTMAGFLEAMKSAFLDPEVGLFGLGRKIQGMEMAMVDQYGNFINTQGKIVSSWDEAAKEQISLYESIQKILTGFGLPLSELATYLPQLFEPFKRLITPLESMFKVAQGFYRNFNIYTKEFEGLAKSLSDMGLKKDAAKMKKSAGARGTLLAISNLLTAFGDMSGAKFKDISTKLQDPAADIAAISKEVMTAVFNSKFVEELGFQIGLLVGGVLSTVAELLGFAKGATDTRIVKGLKEGFEAAGGTQAFKDIFTNFFQIVLKAIKSIFMMAPAQITALVGASLMLPALMAGISVAIGNFIENLVDANLNEIKRFKPKGRTAYTKPIGPLPAPGVTPSQRLAGRTRGTGPAYMQSGVKPRSGFKGFVRGAFGAGTGPQSLLGRSALNAAKNPLKATKGVPVTIKNVAKGAFSAVKGGGLGAVVGGAKNLLGTGMKGLGKVGGIATIGVGIVEAIMALLSGDSLGAALGKGAGPVIGTIIGTALLGPLGGVIGGMIGSLESVTQPLGQMFESVIQTLGVTFEFLGQIGSDVIGVLNGFFTSVLGLGSGFDILKATVFALTLPFRMLELGVRGLYILYLEAKKNFGLASAEEKKKLEVEKKILEVRTALLRKDAAEAAGFGKPGDKSKTSPGGAGKPSAAKPKVGYLTKNGVEGWMGTDGTWTPLATATSPKPKKKPDKIQEDLRNRAGADLKSFWKALTTTPEPPKTVEQNTDNTTDLNRKATDQLRKVGEVKTSTEKTTQAVKDLTSKITSQTNLQTTTAAIYNLLASGTLRVQGTVAGGAGSNGLPPGTPLPLRPGQTGTEWLIERAADPTAWEAFGSPGRKAGSLASAINYENKHKPSGSNLVVANSSETVIPAAGGYGMVDFVDTLKWGFATMISTFRQAQQKQDQMLSSINQTLKANQQQTNMRLLAMEKKFATPGMPGGLGGGAAGGVDAFTPIAQRMGLQMTSGYRPGDPGWHGANRARDFSNGTGPTPQMLQFAQYMASTYGRNLKELIYTPLGFSIKNGQQVPPYAQGSHYNHVHVAYALGAGNPAFFSSQSAAQSWERSMVSGSVRVGSVTGNSAEGFGNNIGSINVTVNAGNISDPDTLADVVAQRILSEMQNTDSIFV